MSLYLIDLHFFSLVRFSKENWNREVSNYLRLEARDNQIFNFTDYTKNNLVYYEVESFSSSVYCTLHYTNTNRRKETIYRENINQEIITVQAAVRISSCHRLFVYFRFIFKNQLFLKNGSLSLGSLRRAWVSIYKVAHPQHATGNVWQTCYYFCFGFNFLRDLDRACFVSFIHCKSFIIFISSSTFRLRSSEYQDILESYHEQDGDAISDKLKWD